MQAGTAEPSGVSWSPASRCAWTEAGARPLESFWGVRRLLWRGTEKKMSRRAGFVSASYCICSCPDKWIILNHSSEGAPGFIKSMTYFESATQNNQMWRNQIHQPNRTAGARLHQPAQHIQQKTNYLWQWPMAQGSLTQHLHCNGQVQSLARSHLFFGIRLISGSQSVIRPVKQLKVHIMRKQKLATKWIHSVLGHHYEDTKIKRPAVTPNMAQYTHNQKWQHTAPTQFHIETRCLWDPPSRRNVKTQIWKPMKFHMA